MVPRVEARRTEKLTRSFRCFTLTTASPALLRFGTRTRLRFGARNAARSIGSYDIARCLAKSLTPKIFVRVWRFYIAKFSVPGRNPLPSGIPPARLRVGVGLQNRIACVPVESQARKFRDFWRRLQ